MAVIQKIRNYSGLLIAVIGIGLAAFVLGDFLGYGPMRTQRFDVGEVEGTPITYQHFEQRVNQQIDNWQAQTGVQTIGQQEAFQFRQQVWNEMVREIIMEEELDRVGLTVPAEELYDMIYGTDPHPILVQSFSDPVTGSYDPQQVIDFLRNFDRLDPSIRRQWLMLEEYMKRERREEKYHQMIGQAYLAPAPLAAFDFVQRNTTADIRFAFKRHDDIDDQAVSVSDRELRRTYDENRHLFHQEASRDIRYVVLPIFPSEEDRENTLEEVAALRDDLAEAVNIEAFINSMSDTRFDPTYYGRGSLSPQIDPEIFDMEPGSIVGPYLEDNAWILAKLVDSQMRPDSMRASHILISYRGLPSARPETVRSYEQARAKADSLLSVVRANPGRFPALASEFSDDPSAAVNQGDLEWFRDGDMVRPFNEAVIETPTGSFVKVETDFGFHVVHVTGKSPATQKAQLAFLTREIEPGSRTIQSAYSRISQFANELRRHRDFETAAEESGLGVREATRLGEMDLTVPGVDRGRQIVRWAFDPDTRAGSFSRIFELDDTFVVATLDNKREEGFPPLEEIRDEVMAMAIRDKKQQRIAEQMREALAVGTLDDMAEEMGLSTMLASNLSFASNSLPGAGTEPRVIGTVFASQENETSRPVKGNNGVFVFEVVRMDEVIVPDDLTQNQRTLQNSFFNRVPGQAFRALYNRADIVDNRGMFF